MVEIVNFKAYPHPLGGEINISYDYSEPITDNCTVYLFKQDTEINNADICKFLDDSEKPDSLTVWVIENYLKKTWDFDVEPSQSYYYKAIIERETALDGPSVSVERSEIAEAVVSEIISEVIIHTVDMKQIVMDGIKKLVKAIVENLQRQNPEGNRIAELQVMDHFPVIEGPTQFFVVTRASSDESVKYWSNVFYQDSATLIKGDVESETINVTWMVVNNPKMRDQMTKIMRGVRFWLLRYLRRQFATGVLNIGITMMADGDENPEDQMHLFYSGMLIHFFIETNMIVTKPSELLESIKVELGFDVKKT